MTPTPWLPGRRAGTAAASAAAVMLSAFLAPASAGALAFRGQATATESVTTGTWGATATPTTLQWTLGSNAAADSTVANTGTIAVSALSYQVTVSTGLGISHFKIAACAVAWVGTKCGGRAGTRIGTNYATGSTTTVTSPLVPPLGGDVYLLVTPTGTAVTTVTVTLAVSVAGTTQTRARAITNQ